MHRKNKPFSRALLEALDTPGSPAELPSWRNDSVRSMEMPRPGVIIVTPHGGSNDPLVLAGGIHGDERAGVVTLDEIVHAITVGTLPVRRPVFLLYGNLAAMRSNGQKGTRCAPGDRGRTSNLNRCFGNGLFLSPQSFAEARANDLMEVLEGELAGHPWIDAIDVHQSFFVPTVAAVRGSGDRSEYTYSMLYPRLGTAETLRWIYEQFSDIVAGAVLNSMNVQHSTFAGYMAQTFEARAATFEQGTIGSTDPLTFVPQLLSNLCHKIAGERTLFTPTGFDVWRSERPILKETECFTFLDDVGAPTATVPQDFVPVSHALIARDGSKEYRVEPDEDRLLFSNATVPLGDRAAQVIRRFETDSVPEAPV